MRRGLEPVAMKPTPPYRVTPHLEHYCLSGEPMPCTYDHESRRWRSLVRFGDSERPMVIVVRSEGQNPALQLLVEDDLDRGLRERAQSIARWIFAIDVDYMDFMSKTAATPLHSLAWRGFGLRPTRAPGVYEALLMSLAWGQEKSARALAELVRRTASSLSIHSERFYGPPDPGKVTALGIDGLRSLGFSQQKAEAVLEVAMAQGSGSLPSLEDAAENPRRAARSFAELRGVGKSAAELAASLISRRPWGGVSAEAVARALKDRLGVSYEAKYLEAQVGDYIGLVYYLLENSV
ncbi:MAG: hypothetical protein ACP5G6_06600 [Conexivisphaera sp.]|jgi:3-methyladenine DNA glycosylase/8-oxoguanine DNA glycosylase